jgi:hypothetical protein
LINGGIYDMVEKEKEKLWQSRIDTGHILMKHGRRL